MFLGWFHHLETRIWDTRVGSLAHIADLGDVTTFWARPQGIPRSQVCGLRALTITCSVGQFQDWCPLRGKVLGVPFCFPSKRPPIGAPLGFPFGCLLGIPVFPGLLFGFP